MTESKKLTFENLAYLMERRGLLSKEQLREVLSRGKAQESRLFTRNNSGTFRRSGSSTEFVSPAEVLASFNLEIPGSQKTLLSEDLITDAFGLNNLLLIDSNLNIFADSDGFYSTISKIFQGMIDCFALNIKN